MGNCLNDNSSNVNTREYFKINPIDCATLILTIKSLTNCGSYGPDGIPYQFIKDVLPMIAWSQHDRGTLAYVLDDDSLFLRAARGWREVTLGAVLAPQMSGVPFRPFTPVPHTTRSHAPTNPNVETLSKELATDHSVGKTW
ncbi:hypothetical protein SK128_001368, partial [Halocaridina rubra]